MAYEQADVIKKEYWITQEEISAADIANCKVDSDDCNFQENAKKLGLS